MSCHPFNLQQVFVQSGEGTLVSMADEEQENNPCENFQQLGRT